MNDAGRAVRISITIDRGTLCRLDADARRRRRSRSRAAAEHIAAAVRSVMLAAEDLPPAEAEQAADIEALRRRLARTILGGTVGWNRAAWEAATDAERGEGAVWGGSGRPAPHWAAKRNRGHSGAPGLAGSCRTTQKPIPNTYQVSRANRAGNERA